ncbi:MAG: hypothetical protein LBH20_02105 [Treponema sp.]|jgi:hypothetical protein|nr:hypothetical protein [Treponema sp.]
MVNKRFWLGMLVMTLVFGMMVVGCGNEWEEGYKVSYYGISSSTYSMLFIYSGKSALEYVKKQESTSVGMSFINQSIGDVKNSMRARGFGSQVDDFIASLERNGMIAIRYATDNNSIHYGSYDYEFMFVIHKDYE